MGRIWFLRGRWLLTLSTSVIRYVAFLQFLLEFGLIAFLRDAYDYISPKGVLPFYHLTLLLFGLRYGHIDWVTFLFRCGLFCR